MTRAVLALAVVCALWNAEIRGNRAFRDREYARAAAEYHRALRDRGSNAALRYNLGTALARLGRFPEAAAQLDSAVSGADAALRQRVHFNRGNTDLEPAFRAAPDSVRDARLRRAVIAYKRALLLQPSDSAAKWNLELALRLLRQPPPSAGGGGGGGGGGAPETPEPEPAPDAADPALAEAERILSGAEQADIRLQQDRTRRGNPQRPVARDW